MTDIIVLVKYVADVNNIPQNAWDTERGTLKRNMLKMVSNPLDDKALNLAVSLKKKLGARITAISMGPPPAEEICRRCIAYGADNAILLTDRNFSGADTIATANTIAAAIKKLISEETIKNPLILAGMQSPDGDTAQVPIQIANMLNYPIAPYVRGWRINDKGIVFESLKTIGYQELLVEKVPVLATVTGFISPLPFYTSIEKMLDASNAKIRVLSANDLDINEQETGLTGSWTRVTKIFFPQKRNKDNDIINFNEDNQLESRLYSIVLGIDNYLSSKTPSRHQENQRDGYSSAEPHYDGDCAVICERNEKGFTEGTLELLGQTYRLSKILGEKSVAIVPAQKISKTDKNTLSKAGAEKIITLNLDPKNESIPEYHANAVAETIREFSPQIVLVPASLKGRVLAPLAAAQLKAGLTADCTGLDIRDLKIKDQFFSKILHQIRPALGGNIMATIVSLRGKENGSPQMASVRQGVFTKISLDNRAETITYSPTKFCCSENLKIIKTTKGIKTDDNAKIEKSDVIISVGMGIGTKENISLYATKLSEAIRKKWNTTVSIACTRAVMEKGIMPYSHQVGQTGKIVKPKIYIALGISGAIQHRVGMENSGIIIAVNSDPSAPIFSFSDYGICADISEAIPAILKLL